MAERAGCATHLLERVCVEQDPTKLNHLGRVLCHINAVLVTGGRNMDHDIAIDVELGQLLRRHGCGGIGRTRTDDDAEKEEKSVCERRGGAAEDDDGKVSRV